MSSRSASPPPTPPDSLDLDEMRVRVVEETINRTGHPPYPWQLNDVLNRLVAKKDTFTIAATGAGKSLTFAMIAFVLKHASITWVLAPLNVIQEQQARVFNDEWEVPTIYINSSANLEKAKVDILAGEYQIVISSPENFFDTNKLRNVVTSTELSKRRHFVVVDEAHVIHTWGGQFRVAYGNCGNLRGMLYGAPFSAVTATATSSVKAAIITALHLGSDRPLVFTNLGNYRKNIQYSVYIMNGGLTSFKEVAAVIASRGPVPTLVFADTIGDTQRITDAVRSELSWTGKLARNVIAYHSIREESGKRDAIQAFQNGECMVIVASEALTMGADFSNVGLVIRLGPPSSATTLAQQCGRAARREDTRAEAIMMITRAQHQKALEMCSGMDDVRTSDIKQEEGLADAMGNLEVEDGTLEDENAVDNESSIKTSKETHPQARGMDMDIARFIATRNCRIKVLDEAFDNPSHEPCYQNGNCDLCVARRARDEAGDDSDAHLAERTARRLEIIEETPWDDELKRKERAKAAGWTGPELRYIRTHLRQWRDQKFLEDVCKSDFSQ
ncbi:hypothetical protein FRC09_014211 [Ceratobasidium sp. 395]|nr:hypothetical protein FRC09_014211 [Ceratobasidium sp. 395]